MYGTNKGGGNCPGVEKIPWKNNHANVLVKQGLGKKGEKIKRKINPEKMAEIVCLPWREARRKFTWECTSTGAMSQKMMIPLVYLGPHRPGILSLSFHDYKRLNCTRNGRTNPRRRSWCRLTSHTREAPDVAQLGLVSWWWPRMDPVSPAGTSRTITCM